MGLTPEIDFTQWRKGRDTGGGRKIILCAKCGRKGRDDGTLTNRKTGQSCQMVTHRAHIMAVSGINCLHIDDHCAYPC